MIKTYSRDITQVCSGDAGYVAKKLSTEYYGWTVDKKNIHPNGKVTVVVSVKAGTVIKK